MAYSYKWNGETAAKENAEPCRQSVSVWNLEGKILKSKIKIGYDCRNIFQISSPVKGVLLVYIFYTIYIMITKLTCPGGGMPSSGGPCPPPLLKVVEENCLTALILLPMSDILNSCFQRYRKSNNITSNSWQQRVRLLCTYQTFV